MLISIANGDDWTPLEDATSDLIEDEDTTAIVASNLNGDRAMAADQLSELAVLAGFAEDSDSIEPEFRYDENGKRLVVSQAAVNDMSASEARSHIDRLKNGS